MNGYENVTETLSENIERENIEKRIKRINT